MSHHEGARSRHTQRQSDPPLQTPHSDGSATSSSVSGSSFWMIVICVPLAMLSLLLILPGPITPVTVELPTYKGREMNTELKKTRRLFEGEIMGPEAFVVDKDGNLYTGLGDGRVVRFTDTQVETVVRLGQPPYDQCGKMTIEAESHCGRPLGMAIPSTAPHQLYIADSYHGIMVYNLRTGQLKTLVNTTTPWDNVPPMKLVNSITLLSNGSIFFTDSSSKFDRGNALLDIMEGAGNGKLMHYQPSSDGGGSLTVALSNLAFPNGVCLSPSEDFLLIAETTKCRILRYYLSGPKAGTTDVFADNLLGLPDNITPARSGGYWVGCGASRHTGFMDYLGRSPWLKNLITKLRLLGIVHSLIPKTGLIFRLSEEGKVLEALWDIGGDVITEVSSVLDMGDRMYFGSYTAPYLGRLNRA